MRFQRYIAPILLSCILMLVCWVGCQNHPDNEWVHLQGLIKQEYFTLDKAVDSIGLMYATFHRKPYDSMDSTAYNLVAKPFLPTMEWGKLRYFFHLITQNHFAVISSVNGSGATTLTDRLGKLIASKPENLMQINCAPQFDLEYHRKYIGYEENGRFQKGALLLLWDQCKQNPQAQYIAIAENFDKINPETFFGPEIWEGLDNPNKKITMGGENVAIPPNFYFIAVTNAGVASKIEFHNDHFRRLGGQYIIEPTVSELIVYLRNEKKANAKDLLTLTDPKAIEKAKNNLAALSDTTNLMRFLFFFEKANLLLEQRYSTIHQLGQWSNIRKFYQPAKFNDLRSTFLNHINSIARERQMSEKDFKDIDYTLATNGLAPRSNLFARVIQYLQDTGYLVELTIIAVTSLLTALAGWWVFRRREKLLRKYGEQTRAIFAQYEAEQISAEDAATALSTIKHEVDELVMSRKINYTEALYFLGFIDDKVKLIEYARNTSETFLDLMNTFLEDQVLSEKEYLKLKNFLQSIRHKISSADYQRFRDEVERVRNQFGSKE